MNKKISSPIAIIIIVVCAVLFGGIVTWYYFGTKTEIEIYEIKLPEKTQPEKTQLEDETADWNIYINENFGIEFKYPENWIVSRENETLVVFENINKSSQRISILKSSGPPPETMRDKLIESKIVYLDKLELNRELFQGKFEDNKDDYYVRIFIPEKAIFYQGGFKKEDLQEFLSLFDKILSTFKFLE